MISLDELREECEENKAAARIRTYVFQLEKRLEHAERALQAIERVCRRQHVPKIIHDIINKWSQDSH